MSVQSVSPSERELLASLRRRLEEKQTADKRKEAEALSQQKKQEKLDKAWAQVAVAAPPRSYPLSFVSAAVVAGQSSPCH
jgi:hypothetical protein